ncbi:MAG: tetratricopeptide repeat protein [bacterium]|nr:tetratricopeptide repeat protein [bacterium]
MDISELTRFVEENPTDYGRRWQLAKKLYTACEYSEALRHLAVLKEQWSRKLNVMRYLAAAHYRLGQYDQAGSELEATIALWPTEVPVREQLAKVREAAGHREEAAQVWESVLELNRDHPLAEAAIARLRSQRKDTPLEELQLAESDSGINLSRVHVCPKCGAQNNEEFDRCWQCHAFLPVAGGSTPLPTEGRQGDDPAAAPWIWMLVGGLLIVGFISYAMYLALGHWAASDALGEQRMVRVTVNGTVAEALFMTRAVIAGVLLLAWPCALWLALVIVRAKRPRASTVNVTGMVLATFAYLMFWVPVAYQHFALAASPALALVLVLVLFRIGFARALGVWAIHIVLVAALATGVFAGMHGIEVLSAEPSVIHYAAEHDTNSPVGARAFQPRHVPTSFRLRWGTTGSEWLDGLADEVSLEIRGDEARPPYAVKVLESGRVVLDEVIVQVPFRTRQRVTLGTEYEIRITGPQGVNASLVVYGVLPIAEATPPH